MPTIAMGPARNGALRDRRGARRRGATAVAAVPGFDVQGAAGLSAAGLSAAEGAALSPVADSADAARSDEIIHFRGVPYLFCGAGSKIGKLYTGRKNAQKYALCGSGDPRRPSWGERLRQRSDFRPGGAWRSPRAPRGAGRPRKEVRLISFSVSRCRHGLPGAGHAGGRSEPGSALDRSRRSS